MPTPLFSLRVKPEVLDRWKAECDAQGVDVSHQIRLLMNTWCTAKSLEREARELLDAKVPSEV